MKRAARTIPTFLLATTPPGGGPLSRHAAAARLGIGYDSLSKLIRAGILDEPLNTEAVDELAHRRWLTTRTGELTVLRTDGPPVSEGQQQRAFGFAVDFTDAQVAEASLGPWRSDPDRVEQNQLLAVVLSTVPVAVYDIERREPVVVDDQGHPRYTYVGTLLTRLHPGPILLSQAREEFASAREGAGSVSIVKNQNLPAPDPRIVAAEIIMNSRIRVESRGPIGYL